MKINSTFKFVDGVSSDCNHSSLGLWCHLIWLLVGSSRTLVQAALRKPKKVGSQGSHTTTHPASPFSTNVLLTKPNECICPAAVAFQMYPRKKKNPETVIPVKTSQAILTPGQYSAIRSSEMIDLYLYYITLHTSGAFIQMNV